MNVLDVLLENFWILRRRDRDLYYTVKDGVTALKPFLEEKLGCPVTVHPEFIRMQKMPGFTESWMGIQDFSDPAEYALFMLVLMFLEDKGAGEQFVLSQLTEYVEAAWPGEDHLDWTLFRVRRQMVNVLRYAVHMNLMSVDDGDTAQFADTRETEVLYEATGLSRHMVRAFTGNVAEYTCAEDIQNGEWLDQDRERGLIRRQRVYRRLLFSPAVQAESTEDQDIFYIRNYRNQIQRDFDQHLGGNTLQVHRNLALLRLDPEKTAFRDVFPGMGASRALVDILLQMCSLLRERVESGQYTPTALDHIVLTRWEAVALIEECRRRFETGWSREYRTMPPDRLVDAVLEGLEAYCLIRWQPDGDSVTFLPLAGRFHAHYPTDFTPAPGADTSLPDTPEED